MTASEAEKEFKTIRKVIEDFITDARKVVESTCVKFPDYASLRANDDATMEWIIKFQGLCSELGNLLPTVAARKTQVHVLIGAMQDTYGKVESDAMVKVLNGLYRQLVELETVVKDRKYDLSQNVLSIRSIQSAITNRLRAGG